MRILIAAHVPNRREGGVAGIVYGAGQGLEQFGHRVEYLFAGDLPCRPSVPKRFEDLEFAVELARFIARNADRYDVANIHAPNACVWGPLRRLLPRMRNSGPAYVMTLHGLEERRVYALSPEASKGRVSHFSFKNRLWHRFYHVPRFYLSIKTSDHAVCYGRDVWTILELKYGLSPRDVSYIPNGVDERFFIRRQHSQSSALRLLYAGTWLEQRGIFYLREALRSLSTQLPGIRLTIAGCGSAEELIKSFFDPALRPLLDVRAIVPSEQMPALLDQHDVFIFPSLMEGTPLAIQEAMAAGLAIVTTETCGMVDLVEDGFNGLLVPPADSSALAKAVLTLAGNPDLRAQLGQAAQETMRRFTWARTAAKTEAACASAMRRNGREPDFVRGELQCTSFAETPTVEIPARTTGIMS